MVRVAGCCLVFTLLCVAATDVRPEDSKEAASPRVADERGRVSFHPPVSECHEANDEGTCAAVNGCSWCLASSGDAGCLDWHQCVGPDGLCELRNSSQCRIGGVGGRGGNVECGWCNSEKRCVPADTGGLGPGQCKGCDGVYDSGKRVDMCGVCGGSCIYLTRQEAVGVALALSGNVLISVSLNLQKYAHNTNEGSPEGRRPYTSLPVWRWGMVLMAIGETGNFLAYAYAPATLVAPLGAASVISNVILARYALKEELTFRNIFGVAMAIGGAVLIVTFAPSSDKQLTMDVLQDYASETGFVIFVSFIIAAIIGLFFLSDTYKRRYVVVYTLICSLTGCLTVMCVKGVSTALILTLQGHNQFFSFVPWMLLLIVVTTAVIQIKYLNLAMMHFGASEVVPVYYVLFTFFSILGGIVLYKEYHQHCPESKPNCLSTMYFLFGCALTFTGVYLISFGKRAYAKAYDDDEKDRLMTSLGDGTVSPDDLEGLLLQSERANEALHRGGSHDRLSMETLARSGSPVLESNKARRSDIGMGPSRDDV